MRYGVFVGWGIDDGGPLESGLTWEAARARLEEKLLPFAEDDCPCCRADGLEALARLRAAGPGAFAAEVDGMDYMILEEGGDERV